jgi:hypothetical protein
VIVVVFVVVVVAVVVRRAVRRVRPVSGRRHLRGLRPGDAGRGR